MRVSSFKEDSKFSEEKNCELCDEVDYVDPSEMMRTTDETRRRNWIESQSKYAFEGLKVLGHRGSMYHELENTRRSFQVVSEMGCDGFELDVFALKCGTLVVFHGGGGDVSPGKLDGYCNVKGNIHEYTADEVRSKIRFNPDFHGFACPSEKIRNNNDAYIPTLEEILQDAKESGVTVKIELKGPGTEKGAVELVDKLDMVDQVVFSSFKHERIAMVREMRPELNSDGTYKYKTGALFNSKVPDNFVEIALKAGATEVHFKYDTCTKERVERSHKAGLHTMVWFRGPIGMAQDLKSKYRGLGYEGEDMYRIVMATGVQAMCVNRPHILLDAAR